MKNVKISRSKIVGIAAYKKKDEYDSASIKGNHIVFDDNTQDYLLEDPHTIEINNILYDTNATNLKYKFYGK